ncbi:MAG TPA: phosphatase [Methanoregulaceae archaeon]|nr:phosphatase [Methanoregulaceae archaeon]
MIEIHPNLFIGNEYDYEHQVRGQPGWRVVHACKDPYHRQALGYTGRAASKDHPEYLIARRDGRLILNLIDPPNPDFVPKEIIDAALDYIRANTPDTRVLVHCNQGESRSPAIGILYLAAYTDRLPRNFLEAEAEYQRIYPPYNPGRGIRGFLINNWEGYLGAE